MKKDKAFLPIAYDVKIEENDEKSSFGRKLFQKKLQSIYNNIYHLD